MTFTEFTIKYDGKFLDYDGIYPNQCVDLIKQYFKNVLGILPIKGNAIDYWNNTLLGFDKIKNTPINWPQQGDLIVWNIGQYGHIGICNSANVFTLNSFCQNFPLGSPCHFQKHNYKYVLGWLRPKKVVSALDLPKIPLKVARIGAYLPQPEAFISKVQDYSSGKISCVLSDYSENLTGMMDQDRAYKLVDYVNPAEKFVFIFYSGNPDSVFYATYYYPKRDCVITTAPDKEPRLLAFEFAHQVQTFYNTHRGNKPYVEVVDSNFPSDDLIRAKYDSVSGFYQ